MKRAGVADRHGRERGDVAAVDLDGQGLGPEPGPMTGRGRPDNDASGSRKRARAACNDRRSRSSKKALRPVKSLPGTPSSSRSTCSAVRRWNGTSTGMSSRAAAASKRSSKPCHSRRRPGGQRARADRPRRVGHDPAQVELHRPAETLADRAGPQRAVVAEQVGLGLDGIRPAPAHRQPRT